MFGFNFQSKYNYLIRDDENTDNCGREKQYNSE